MLVILANTKRCWLFQIVTEPTPKTLADLFCQIGPNNDCAAAVCSRSVSAAGGKIVQEKREKREKKDVRVRARFLCEREVDNATWEKDSVSDR